MRKIPAYYDNPIDNTSYRWAEYVSPLFHRLGWTANDLTFTALILGLISVYALWKGHPAVAAVLYYFQYVFDCWDGYYARKYRSFSPYGDLFDHYRDLLINGLMLTLLFYRWGRYSIPLTIIWAVILLGAFITMTVHLNCQERISGNQSGFLSTMTLGWGEPKELARVTRHGGCGTFCLLVLVMILFCPKNKS